ncbi:Transcriptional regulatory protein WalR [Roseimaritima multifibrata]|uniref:Transcriptional regulatory protein WalR n=1 Tax=Roseimaritima multifibrata TaxID=1930274 RepID=A0A517MM19_9BACT|nr:response regulator [Roseimaritima multifibrata]QDS95931.1 Transcriptional regulatory protein WalR [Roseimaritima multifibrata]
MNTRRHVLIAEDNRVLADVLHFNLQRAGFLTTIARDGLQAMAALRHQPFDLLLTDYQMPGANGEQICHYVRDVLSNKTMPIFICSAKGLELDTASLRDKWQVIDVIFKPFSVREIIRQVSEATSTTTDSSPPLSQAPA